MEHTRKQYTISVYTENNIGLLNRISAIFQRRHINIESMNISISEIEAVSRFTILVNMTEVNVRKIIGQIEKQIEVIGEEINHNFNFFDCMDVNGDQMSDIVAQVFSQPWDDQDDNEGVPEVYINTGNGYMNIDTSSWPTYSINDGSQGYLFDVDSSGTFDLVMFPLKMNISGDVEIFLSNRHVAN